MGRGLSVPHWLAGLGWLALAGWSGLGWQEAARKSEDDTLQSRAISELDTIWLF